MQRTRIFFVITALCVAGGIGAEVFPDFHFPRFVQMIMLLIACFVGAWAFRGTAANWLVGASSLLVGLIVLEGVCAMFEPGRPVSSDSELIKSRPIVGWGATKPGIYPAKKSAPDGHVIYDVKATIDKDLIRETKSASGPHGYPIFGDSFVYGDGLNDEDTLPQAFADLFDRKVPVLNLGFSGWSPAQNLAALQAGFYKALIKDPKRFIMLTAAWHIDRTACKAPFSKRAPRYEWVGNEIKLDGPCFTPAGKVWRGFISRFAIYRVLIDPIASQLTHMDVEKYLKIVDTFVKLAKKDYAVKTTIIYIPFGDAYVKSTGFTETQIIEGFRKSGADVMVDALPPISDPKLYEIQGDGHPTGLANRARAKELQDYLAKVETTDKQATDATP